MDPGCSRPDSVFARAIFQPLLMYTDEREIEYRVHRLFYHSCCSHDISNDDLYSGESFKTLTVSR